MATPAVKRPLVATRPLEVTSSLDFKPSRHYLSSIYFSSPRINMDGAYSPDDNKNPTGNVSALQTADQTDQDSSDGAEIYGLPIDPPYHTFYYTSDDEPITTEEESRKSFKIPSSKRFRRTALELMKPIRKRSKKDEDIMHVLRDEYQKLRQALIHAKRDYILLRDSRRSNPAGHRRRNRNS